jgi:hypothetical protein
MTVSVIAAAAVAGILILAILPVISSTNQAFAQAKPTTLGIGTYPCCERKTLNPTVNQGFTGQLISEGSGVGGATIHIIGVPGFWFDKTSEYGRYGVEVPLGPGTYHIHAHFAGDSEHASSDSRTITFTVTH